MPAFSSERGLPHTFKLIDGGGHAWSSRGFAEDLRFAFIFVGEGFRPKADADREPAEGATSGGRR